MQDLIRKECCNCISGECVPRSKPCDMLAVVIGGDELPRYKMCSWFKDAVLPSDDKLLSRYIVSSSAEDDGVKTCSLCGKTFFSEDGRQTMCKECKTMDSRKKNYMKRVKKNVKR